mmetsp:Transcript_12881/g.19961  ORF Transcript_12881/g.19961 Transcript_12881/m.19961 type:complete len:619 (+) Transcript_12881:197-2053(+)
MVLSYYMLFLVLANIKNSVYPFVPSRRGPRIINLPMMSVRGKSSLTQLVFNESNILWEWASHSNESFHDFEREEAIQIREALLKWYRSNRRKLPWRGDPPPYDGSTAGINDEIVKSKKRGKKSKTASDKNQTSIKNFFLVPSAQDVKRELSETVKNEVIESQTSQKVRNVTAYGVWVSEIMLQQTRVEAVIPYYIKWMDRFPTVDDLAEASEEDVNAHWAGLGFYRRARFLHSGAKLVVEKYEGCLPGRVEELMEISGIGRYTASAIASIAFDVCVPVVDGNVCRVLSRLRGIANHIKSPTLKDNFGWRLAEQIVQAGDGKYAGEVNQALMELGATYCAPSGSGTHPEDPLRDFYLSTKLASNFELERQRLMNEYKYETFPVETYINKASNQQSSCCPICDSKYSILEGFNEICVQGPFTISHGPFPPPPPKGTKREEVLAVAVICIAGAKDDLSKYLLVKRPDTGLLAGQWEFPSVCVWSSADQKKSTTKSKKRKETRTVPFVDEDVRSEALTEYLRSLINDEVDTPPAIFFQNYKRTHLQEPKEHIFSHVRHTMWIEHQSSNDDDSVAKFVTSWTASNGKSVRWMTKADMERVGVTSGVKKILKAAKPSVRKKSKK